MTCQVADMGTPSRASTAQVTVIIQKDNGTLTVPNYNFTVDETIPVQTTVGNVIATPSVSIPVCSINVFYNFLLSGKS